MIPRLNLPANLKAVPGKRQPRAAYALPTFFTAVNMFLGYTAILKSYAGVVNLSERGAGPCPEFEQAAIMIGVAVVTDGIDGRVARMTNTVSDFGREMDSLADAITFGLAPAVLAFAWGVQFVDASGNPFFREHLLQIGYFVSFLFMLCGASRLARFNVTTNPIPKNPGRPDRKYFVGLPIPAAAGFVAAVVYALNADPIRWWIPSVLWLALLALLSFLMVSTWRYRSFKDLSLLRPRSPLFIILVASLVYLIIGYSKAMFVTMGLLYVGSGIVVRAGGIVRRYLRPHPEPHAT
ncbi:MAG TPA: CDP-diacylglycerol--serine O-phosphatidyltransferase [Bryobacteraceae bacterium]|nr:CDP-diacylglycerol--serine O-phosphatidyltransferase [Bryobacteraceae bacterium]